MLDDDDDDDYILQKLLPRLSVRRA